MRIIKRLTEYDKRQCRFSDHIRTRSYRLRTLYTRFGVGRTVDVFVVDRGHSNGYEVHVLKNNRLVEIYNFNTAKFITVLYARPQQLDRYYFNRTPHHKFNKFIRGYNEI